MIAKEHAGHIRQFKKQSIYRLEITRGIGTPDCVCRIVVQWWLPNGEMLLEQDPMADVSLPAVHEDLPPGHRRCHRAGCDIIDTPNIGHAHGGQ